MAEKSHESRLDALRLTNAIGHEILLEKGSVRIQITPLYLLIDLKIPLNPSQAVAMGLLFQNRFGQVVKELFGWGGGGGKGMYLTPGPLIASNGFFATATRRPSEAILGHLEGYPWI